MAHLIENMAYVGATPWHGLGNSLTPNQPIIQYKQQSRHVSDGTGSFRRQHFQKPEPSSDCRSIGRCIDRWRLDADD